MGGYVNKLLIPLMLVVLASSVFATSWPEAGYDAANTGYSATVVGGLQYYRAFTYDLGAGVTATAAAYDDSIGANGQIYVTDSTGIVSAIDPATMAPNWAYFTVGAPGLGISSAPAIDMGLSNFYFGSDDVLFYAVTPGGVDLFGPTPIGNIIQGDATVYAPLGMVFFGANDGKMYCYTVAGVACGGGFPYSTGNSITYSPAVANVLGTHELFIPNSNGHLEVVDASNGNQILSANVDIGNALRSVVFFNMLGIDYIAMTSSSGLVAVYDTNLAFLWSAVPGGSAATASYCPAGICAPMDVIIVPSSDGNLYALDASAGAPVWTYNIGSPMTTAAAISADGYVFVGANDGIHAINTNAGAPAEIWHYTTPSAVSTDVILFDDGANIYVQAGAGRYSYLFELTNDLAVLSSSAISGTRQMQPGSTPDSTRVSVTITNTDPIAFADQVTVTGKVTGCPGVNVGTFSPSSMLIPPLGVQLFTATLTAQTTATTATGSCTLQTTANGFGQYTQIPLTATAQKSFSLKPSGGAGGSLIVPPPAGTATITNLFGTVGAGQTVTVTIPSDKVPGVGGVTSIDVTPSGQETNFRVTLKGLEGVKVELVPGGISGFEVTPEGASSGGIDIDFRVPKTAITDPAEVKIAVPYTGDGGGTPDGGDGGGAGGGTDLDGDGQPDLDPDPKDPTYTGEDDDYYYYEYEGTYEEGLKSDTYAILFEEEALDCRDLGCPAGQQCNQLATGDWVCTQPVTPPVTPPTPPGPQLPEVTAPETPMDYVWVIVIGVAVAAVLVLLSQIKMRITKAKPAASLTEQW